MTKKEKYKAMQQYAKTIIDELGKHLDKGIFELVVLLNLHGIETSMSCEGHRDWAHPFPWVTFDETHTEKVRALIKECFGYKAFMVEQYCWEDKEQTMKRMILHPVCNSHIKWKLLVNTYCYKRLAKYKPKENKKLLRRFETFLKRKFLRNQEV